MRELPSVTNCDRKQIRNVWTHPSNWKTDKKLQQNNQGDHMKHVDQHIRAPHRSNMANYGNKPIQFASEK